MARVGRLAGAILAESDGAYFLVGNTKEPCDFAAAGFAAPAAIDALVSPAVRLSPTSQVRLPSPWLELDVEGEALPQLLTRCFLVERNGSVSERLWRLVTDPEASGRPPKADGIDARWLVRVPDPVWKIVRDAILRCS
jgi:hypothetical protein